MAAIFYELRGAWDIAGRHRRAGAVPAREIIHDRRNTFYHPLVGLSKMYAAGVAGHAGSGDPRNEIETCFANGSSRAAC